MAQACDTSAQTIRRDLNALEDEGKVQRYHGGARLAGVVSSDTYETRSASHVEEKEVLLACFRGWYRTARPCLLPEAQRWHFRRRACGIERT